MIIPSLTQNCCEPTAFYVDGRAHFFACQELFNVIVDFLQMHYVTIISLIFSMCFTAFIFMVLYKKLKGVNDD